MYALFDCIIDPESKRYLSEDYTFCRRWQQIDGAIWLDPRVALNHVGHYTFRGNVRKMLTGESSSSNYVSPDVRPFVVGKSNKIDTPKAEEKNTASQNKIQLSKKK